MNLAEALEMAETALARELSGDEIVLVGRMVDADESAEDILAMLDKPTPIPPDDAGKTYRYEALGNRVVEIPDASTG
jgi:hypothetical protein